MIALILPACGLILALALAVALVRLLAGPTILDRILAFDMVAFCIVGIIVLLSVHWETPIFIEIMLIFSLLGFVGTVAFISYLYTNPGRFRLFEDIREIEEEDPDA